MNSQHSIAIQMAFAISAAICLIYGSYKVYDAFQSFQSRIQVEAFKVNSILNQA